jgi:hypothetical protein
MTQLFTSPTFPERGRGIFLTANASAAEVVGQFGPGSMEPGLDRSDRSSDGQGDLFVRQTLFVEEDEDHSIIRPEATEGSIEFAGQIVGVAQTGAVVDAFLDRLREDWSAISAAEGGSAAVGGDPEEPGTEGTFRVESRDPPQGAHERFLDNVLSVLPMPHHPEAEAEDHAVETVQEKARGLRVARPERFDQRTVVHQCLAFAGRSGRRRAVERLGIPRL